MSWCNSVTAVARGLSRAIVRRTSPSCPPKPAIMNRRRRVGPAIAVVSGFSRPWIGPTAIVVIGLLSSSCGYALAGRGSFLPDYIQTIGIPTFTNSTSYLDIAQILTDKIRSEFIGRGRYRIVPEAQGVDALLNGVVTGISIAPASFNQGQQASRYVITVTANIELRDVQKDVAVWANPAMTFQDEYEAEGGANVTDPAAFFGQESNAVQRVSTEFARAVVSAILEAF